MFPAYLTPQSNSWDVIPGADEQLPRIPYDMSGQTSYRFEFYAWKYSHQPASSSCAVVGERKTNRLIFADVKEFNPVILKDVTDITGTCS